LFDCFLISFSSPFLFCRLARKPRAYLTPSEISASRKNISAATVALLPLVVEVMRRVDPQGYVEDWEAHAADLMPSSFDSKFEGEGGQHIRA
jgi:hypothetical protein